MMCVEYPSWRLSLSSQSRPTDDPLHARQDLDAMNDEAIVLLRNKMFQAADADIEENEANRFAINKLRLLPTVVEMMQKCVSSCARAPDHAH